MFHSLQIFAWICALSAVVIGRRYLQKKSADIGPEISFLNVDKVWQETNITGKNIVVAVLDDGVNHRHEDLKDNYNDTLSYDFVNEDADPSPAWSSSSHGTKCAGIIAAKWNGKCRTGIAYEAELVGVRIFGESSSFKDKTTDGLGYNKENIDIYSNSWGPKDNGHSTKGPDINGTKALKYGALKGRNKRGSIFVFSSGNGGFFGDSCAFDGYVNSIYTIAIGAVTKTGAIPRYAESCSSVIASTYGDEVKTSDILNSCNSQFGKTSVAAAFASGIVALLLDANNKLTWRDVQHLIIRTSNPRKTKIEGKDWTVNGAGLMVHSSVGFGVMDAKKLVDVGQKWTNVQGQTSCLVRLDRQNLTIKRDGTEVSLDLPKTCSTIKTLEHVQVSMTLSFSPRAFLLMDLISPEGTKSQLLYQRMFDAITRRKDYRVLKVTSLHFWGENPTANNGTWTVFLKSAKFINAAQVKLFDFIVTFYGTIEDPMSKNAIDILPSGTISCPQGGKMFWKGYGSKCCGSSWTYNPEHERCCQGTSKIVEKSPLCGVKEYNKCEQLCCDGKLLDITRDSEEMFCCGTWKYSKKEHVCCGRKIYDKFSCKKKWIYTHYRWGHYQYIRHERKCSNGQSIKDDPIYPHNSCQPRIAKEEEDILSCAAKRYNKTKQVCCGRKIYDKFSCRTQWNWRNQWYIHEATCSNGRTLRHFLIYPYQKCPQPSLTKQRMFYCGGVKYNPTELLCCGRKIHSKTSCKWPHWGKQYIHDVGCSSDQTLTHVLKRPYKTCSLCGEMMYNKAKEVCCSKKIYAKSSCESNWVQAVNYGWHQGWYFHEAICSYGSITHHLTYPYQTCQPSAIKKMEDLVYCGFQKYSKTKQVCCGRRIYNKISCKSQKKWIKDVHGVYIGYRLVRYNEEARCSNGQISYSMNYQNPC